MESTLRRMDLGISDEAPEAVEAPTPVAARSGPTAAAAGLPLSPDSQTAAEQMAAVERVAALASELFEDPARPPDLEFGAFAAINGPVKGPHAGRAVLRVDLGEWWWGGERRRRKRGGCRRSLF